MPPPYGDVSSVFWQGACPLHVVMFPVCSGREHAPSIIFMDEVDSIGTARTDNSGGGGDSEVQRTMLELLNQLDGFEASNKIKVRAIYPCLA
jgi:ATP-dependent 26S proteasome regulatory subunit